MDNQSIKSLVHKKYSELAKQGGEGDSCCGPSCCSTDSESGAESWESGDITMIGNEYEGIQGYLASADLKLGCGLPTEHAGLKEGHTVLDLGSGAGNDCFIARQEVGESGKVIGLDFSAEMLTLANSNLEKMGFKNMDFIEGEIENIPLADDSVDVVVSNCVMNLVPDKKAAYQEAFRVIKPGGHFSIADIVYDGEMPDAIRQIADLLTGCVAGAIPRDEYLATIEEAGFENVEIKVEKEINFPQEAIDRFAKGIDLSSFRVVSLTINGTKPAVS